MSNLLRHTETFFATSGGWDDGRLPLGFGRLASTMNICNYNVYNRFLMEICLCFYSFL